MRRRLALLASLFWKAEPMNVRANNRPRRNETPTHKFTVGARVFHKVGHLGDRRSFRVVRLMPDGGAGLQYRLRCDADGHERVALEAALERPDSDDMM